jgi:hypothetical protein
MYFSIEWCSLRMAINKSRNMQQWFSIHGQVKFVGNKLIIYSPIKLTKQHRQTVFENSVLRKIFGSKRNEVTGNEENCIISSITICNPHQIQWNPVITTSIYASPRL